MPDINDNFSENDRLNFMVDYSDHHNDSMYYWRYLRTTANGVNYNTMSVRLAEEQPDEVDPDWDEYV